MKYIGHKHQGFPPPQTPVEVKDSPGKGKGVFASIYIPADCVLLESPVLLISYRDLEAISENAFIHDYRMAWDDENEAIALNMVNLINHSDSPNSLVLRCLHTKTMRVVSMRAISAGEEVTCSYQCPPWFEVR